MLGLRELTARGAPAITRKPIHLQNTAVSKQRDRGDIIDETLIKKRSFYTFLALPVFFSAASLAAASSAIFISG